VTQLIADNEVGKNPVGRCNVRSEDVQPSAFAGMALRHVDHSHLLDFEDSAQPRVQSHQGFDGISEQLGLVGIDGEPRQRVFEPFYQVEPKQSAGEGLGLTIVARSMTRMGGSVWMESEEGKGSRFFFSLPAAGR